MYLHAGLQKETRQNLQLTMPREWFFTRHTKYSGFHHYLYRQVGCFYRRKKVFLYNPLHPENDFSDEGGADERTKKHAGGDDEASPAKLHEVGPVASDGDTGVGKNRCGKSEQLNVGRPLHNILRSREPRRRNENTENTDIADTRNVNRDEFLQDQTGEADKNQNKNAEQTVDRKHAVADPVP